MDFPLLATDHYRLRQILRSDQPFIFQGLSHPLVTVFYGVRYDSFEAAQGQMDWYDALWRDKTGIWWLITDHHDQPAGACGFNYYNAAHEKTELGFWLLPAWQRRGIMKEVLPVIVRHIFSHWRVHRIEALVETGNTASGSLLRRLGFTFEGILRDCEVKDGKRISLEMYSLLKTDKLAV